MHRYTAIIQISKSSKSTTKIFNQKTKNLYLVFLLLVVTLESGKADPVEQTPVQVFNVAMIKFEAERKIRIRSEFDVIRVKPINPRSVIENGVGLSVKMVVKCWQCGREE